VPGLVMALVKQASILIDVQERLRAKTVLAEARQLAKNDQVASE